MVISAFHDGEVNEFASGRVLPPVSMAAPSQSCSIRTSRRKSTNPV